LEEVIVGRPENAHVPPFTIEVKIRTTLVIHTGHFINNMAANHSQLSMLQKL
jgi:hypothetical protein